MQLLRDKYNQNYVLDEHEKAGGHLGFPIGIKNRNLVKNIPMIIHLQFGFSQFISFREEDL
jgi:hypothetical protein